MGPSHVGVSALRYPSGQADPLYIGGQMSTSSATGIVVAEVHAEPEQSSHTTSLAPGGSASRIVTHIAGIVGQPVDGVGASTELTWKELV